jgi:hypothetical protein
MAVDPEEVVENPLNIAWSRRSALPAYWDASMTGFGDGLSRLSGIGTSVACFGRRNPS